MVKGSHSGMLLGAGPEPMKTVAQIEANAVFVGSGFAGWARAPE